MSPLQAVVIALGYAFARSTLCAGLGGMVFSQPLFAGAFAGLVMGDPVAGAALGGALNLATLAISTVQKPLPVAGELALVGYIGVPLLLLSGVKSASAQGTGLLAALVGLGLLLTFVRGVFNTMIAHWVDVAVEQGSPVSVLRGALVASQVWVFITAFFPAFFMLRLDVSALANLQLPATLTSVLVIAQQVLAAYGIALLARQLVRGSGAAYFALGWLVSGLIGGAATGQLPVLLLGSCVALIHMFIARRRAIDEQSTHQRETAGVGSNTPAIPNTMLNRAWLTWLFTSDAMFNFERQQNLALGLSLAHLARRLYPEREARALFMGRSLSLFSTEPVVGAAAVGLALAGERLMEASPAMISAPDMMGARAAIMTACAGVGGPLMTLVLAVNIAIGAALASRGSLLGPVLFVILQALLVWAISYASFSVGHSQARRLYIEGRERDWLSAGLFAASRVGAFALGMLVVQLAAINLDGGSALRINDAQISMSAWFDRIAPNMAAMLLVALMAWLPLRKP